MDIEIRDYRNEDLDLLSEIYARAFTNTGTKEKWTSDSARRYLESFLEKKSLVMKTACVGSRIVGGIIAVFNPWWKGNNMTIEEIFVDPDLQKSGIGRLLMESVVREGAEKHGITSVFVVAFTEDHPIRWYRKAGFRDMNDLRILKGRPDEVLKNLNKA